jgi:Tfp pilus assembly protein FimT
MPGQRARRGTTLIEQLLILLLLGVLLSLATVRGAMALDAVMVSSATHEVGSLFADARIRAYTDQRRTAVRIDSARALLILHADTDTLARLALAPRGIRLWASRDSMAYTAAGLGVGAANLRLVLTRGGTSDTLTVSRLGRVSFGD